LIDVAVEKKCGKRTSGFGSVLTTTYRHIWYLLAAFLAGVHADPCGPGVSNLLSDAARECVSYCEAYKS